MEASLEELAFLSRSPNRVQVLDTLAGERLSQRELRDEVSVSRATIARILTQLEDRNWVAGTGNQYEITALGELVISEFLPLVDCMETVQRLGEVFHLLPADDIDLDLRNFSSADVIVPDKSVPTKHMDRGLDLLRDADQIRILAWTALPEYVTVIRDRLEATDLRFECVVPASFLDDLGDQPSLHDDFMTLADVGTVHRYDGTIPYNLFISDGHVFFWLCNADGTEQAALVCTDDPVCSWAEKTYETYRTLADEFEVQTLSS